nr:C13 family peptidase [Chiayiivirga flava]
MYVLAFGGDAGEDVFRNEVEYIERLFPQRFDAAGRVLGLLNHPDSVATRPLATATNLERGLAAIGERIDPDEDIVFVYLTSHGSEDHELYVNQPPLPFDQITPQRLRAALDASGIRWRVVVVSACFSGGFVEALRDPQTLVITAARADRTSFGCGSESDITWFGNAFVAEALNRTTDLREAFETASTAIAEREKAEEFDPSEPQWDAGERILAQLDRWRAGFTPGAALPFVPRPDTPAGQAAAGDADGAARDAVPARTGPDDTDGRDTSDEAANAIR